MQSNNRNWRRLGSLAPVAGWFVVFYFYVLFRVRPELFYQQNPAVFLFDAHFFRSLVNPPGGLVEYVSSFLSPLLALGWLGALVITSLAALVCLATRQLMAAMGRTPGPVVSLAPSLLILMMLGQYNHPVRVCVGLCTVLGLAVGYARLGRRHWAVRCAAFGIGSALAYWAAAGLYAVFAILCGIFEWRVARHRWLGALWVIAAAVVPVAVGQRLWVLSLDDAYRGILLPRERYWLAVPSSALLSRAVRMTLLLFFPIAALAATWRRRRGDRPSDAPGSQPSPQQGDALAGAASHPRWWLRPAIPWAVMIVFGIAADVFLFDVTTKASLLVASSAEHQQWGDVLTYAGCYPPSNVCDVFQVNRALYHRGELLERMFAYPQVADSVPSLSLQFESPFATAERAPLECSDLLFELGRINESEHMVYEALELFGERADTLKRLVYLHLVKGELDAARRFLAALERSLLHGGWAREWLRRLDADPTLAEVPVVASRRALMVQKDQTGRLDLETMLVQLLERNPRNRMALEYLMAYYLLTRRVDKVVANVHRFDVFGEAALPRHCEEAVLVYLQTAGSRAIDLGGRKIRPETQRRGVQFMEAASRFQGSRSAALAALGRDFGDSYFFFHWFGRNDRPPEPARPSR